MGQPSLVRIPDQHALVPPEEPHDDAAAEADITASFHDAHRVLQLVEHVLAD